MACYPKASNHYLDYLVQDCSNSSALAMELLQSCIKPAIWSITDYLSDNIPRNTSLFTFRSNVFAINHQNMFEDDIFYSLASIC